MDIVKRLRRTRATMLGTDDEQHFSDCHEAADEIERLRHAMLTAARRLEKGGDEYGVGYELRVAMTPNGPHEGPGAALSRTVPLDAVVGRHRE